MALSGCVRIGKIIKAHGLKGVAKVYAYGESSAVFKMGRCMVAVGEDGSERNLTVKWAKPDNRMVLLAFAGIDNRDQAETLIGSELFADQISLPELEEGTYYWADIIGLDVYSVDEDYIGKVTSIIPTGANDVYVVKSGEMEILVPALEWVVLSVDPENRVMRVKLPEGL